jgi:hypothetical protein
VYRSHYRKCLCERKQGGNWQSWESHHTVIVSSPWVRVKRNWGRSIPEHCEVEESVDNDIEAPWSQLADNVILNLLSTKLPRTSAQSPCSRKTRGSLEANRLIGF